MLAAVLTPLIKNKINKQITRPGITSSWETPVSLDSRLGFEMSSYAGADNVSALESLWAQPVSLDARLGFEMSSYAGADNVSVSGWEQPTAFDARLGFEMSGYAGADRIFI